MTNPKDASLNALDQPQVSAVLFHPRPEPAGYGAVTGTDVSIPAAREVALGARFHLQAPTAANVLFFHGNGEIVADYDTLAPLYNRMAVNFLCVDYRGYGRSQGTPGATTLLNDARAAFDFTRQWLAEHRFEGPLIVMGRSLGSAAALEIVATRADKVAGLIIESGFASAVPLLHLFGVDAETIGYREETGFRHLQKIGGFKKPTLIIHAQRDHLIALSQGQALYEACGAADKALVVIADANHNDIFQRGQAQYMQAIKALIHKVT